MAAPKITVSPDGKKLTIEVDLTAKGELSASKKSLVISSTRGNMPVETPAGTVYVGLNVYKKA